MQSRELPLAFITIITIILLNKFLCRIMFSSALCLYDLMFLVYTACMNDSTVQLIGLYQLSELQLCVSMVSLLQR